MSMHQSPSASLQALTPPTDTVSPDTDSPVLISAAPGEMDSPHAPTTAGQPLAAAKRKRTLSQPSTSIAPTSDAFAGQDAQEPHLSEEIKGNAVSALGSAENTGGLSPPMKKQKTSESESVTARPADNAAEPKDKADAVDDDSQTKKELDSDQSPDPPKGGLAQESLCKLCKLKISCPVLCAVSFPCRKLILTCLLSLVGCQHTFCYVCLKQHLDTAFEPLRAIQEADVKRKKVSEGIVLTRAKNKNLWKVYPLLPVYRKCPECQHGIAEPPREHAFLSAIAADIEALPGSFPVHHGTPVEIDWSKHFFAHSPNFPPDDDTLV
ncbi:hypothetical protein HGRIS_012394 [Hohenbuehelia grisea]|uniref:RING-type domain-containing protein n=1 Tax=Hohenbuehelia grisea TaxID=104357 RepID=A0ABR3IS64_9AGAR